MPRVDLVRAPALPDTVPDADAARVEVLVATPGDPGQPVEAVAVRPA
jgi:hypothetical protein